jgi:hypothetical protein
MQVVDIEEYDMLHHEGEHHLFHPYLVTADMELESSRTSNQAKTTA